MKEHDEREAAQTERRAEDINPATRASERGDVAEPNAPTGVEENEGLSTILSADTPSGVQKDAADE